MRVTFDRDAVAAGDDLESHAITLTLPEGTVLRELVRLAPPLVQIAGGRATWALTVGGTPVAVLTQEPPAARLLLPESHPIGTHAGPDGHVRVHAHYLAQESADEVLSILGGGERPSPGESLSWWLRKKLRR